ncbi:helix-turn-helix domain-containing protein [Brevibacillus dissolubilis]|uniref:helix-turn-helix domain-containing protein n=1 Tax=Brevibacillus dissolubilis TaxID=1844116 RepID=UPI001115EEA0|nr:cupin domain-containing protein [Brevibacillus dissolubilis]
MSSLPIEMIGNKIRTVRKERGFTLEIMATKTGLSKGLLSQVERGISQPSLESLWRITKALEAPLIHFFEDIEHNHIHVIPKDKRRKMVFPESTGTYSLLSAGGNAKLGLIEVRLQPGEQTRDMFVAQDGEECLTVITGNVMIRVGEEEFHLEAGDSIYFDNSQIHIIANISNEEAVLVWALSPPQF